MSFFTPTNESRVQKIVDIIEMLKKSAASNKADQSDAMKLIDPFITAVEEFIAGLPGALTGASEPVEEPTAQEKSAALQQAEIAVGREVADAIYAISEEQNTDKALRILNGILEDKQATDS